MTIQSIAIQIYYDILLVFLNEFKAEVKHTKASFNIICIQVNDWYLKSIGYCSTILINSTGVNIGCISNLIISDYMQSAISLIVL